MSILRKLLDDKEYQQLRKEWKEKYTEPFPVFNFDEYSDTKDFKEKVKARMKELEKSTQ